MALPTNLQRMKTGEPPIGSHKPLAHGWDTIVEAYDLFPIPNVAGALETWKERAVADGERLPVQIAGRQWWVLPMGVRSWPWLLEDDEGRFVVKLRARAPDTGVMVEYRSAALWACDNALDWGALQAEVYELLQAFCSARDGKGMPPKVSRADYAFDFYAPEFSQISAPELYHQWSANSKVKRNMKIDVWGNGRRVETWTLGSKTSLQVQLYDKAKEITQVSGKDWMSDVHKLNAREHGLACYPTRPTDVWRLEFRLGKDWLKRRWPVVDGEKRSARIRDVFIDQAPNLIAEAMRLIQLKEPERPGRAKQLDRRPAHWFWGVAAEAIGQPTARPYVARLTTGRRQALSDMFRKSAFGYLRSLSVLETGDCDEDTLEDLLQAAREGILADPAHKLKVGRADRRYALVDRPR